MTAEGIPRSAAVQQAEQTAPEDEFGAKDFRQLLTLKEDHGSRPLWVVSGAGCQT